jgi:hypothetical protein
MFFSEVVKPPQWVTLKELRDELDRTHPALGGRTGGSG